MAAWTAQINSVSDAGDFEHAVVGVSYFDATDTGFTTPLWSHTFTFEFGSPQADIVTAIRKLGQQQRSVSATIAGLQSQVGATVNVP